MTIVAQSFRRCMIPGLVGTRIVFLMALGGGWLDVRVSPSALRFGSR